MSKLKLSDRIVIFTDGSCNSNPGGDGGWSVLIIQDKDHSITINGYEPSTTNQRMELMAVNSALSYFLIKKKITLYTDSSYVANCFKQQWYRMWEKNGWKNSKGEDVANKDLWLIFIRLIKLHDVDIRHVKGHSTNPFNNSCDIMAKNAILFHKSLSKYLSEDDNK